MESLLTLAIRAGIEASKEVLDIYNRGFEVEWKEDNSPVTTGDLKANEIIIQHIKNTPYPILSEESEQGTAMERRGWEKYWCIDPIDGTQEYVNRTGEYCVSIGFITPETSLLGIIAAPAMGDFYFAAEGIGSYKWKGNFQELYQFISKDNFLEEIIANSKKMGAKPSLKKYTLLISRSHLTETDRKYYEKLEKEKGDISKIPMGSAVKMAKIAEGVANESVRLSSISFWDIAGGHAIAKYAGLELIDFNTGENINYKNVDTLKVSGYIVKNI